jgi:rubrerythrin
MKKQRFKFKIVPEGTWLKCVDCGYSTQDPPHWGRCPQCWGGPMGKAYVVHTMKLKATNCT